DRVNGGLEIRIKSPDECRVPEIVPLRKLGTHLLKEPQGLPGVRFVSFLERLIEIGGMERVDADRVRVECPRESEPAAIVRLGDRELSGEVPGRACAKIDAADEHRTRAAARVDLEPASPRADVPGRLGGAATEGGSGAQEDQQ